MSQSYGEVLASAFEDELTKIAKAKLSTITPFQKALGLMAAGAGTYELVRRADGDRRMGRAMRIQQGAF
jgi:hypothetical protein